MQADHQADGHHIIDWVLKQPWCDGRIICFGLGFEAVTALAAGNHPSVIAVVAQQPRLEFPLGRSQDRPLHLESMLAWRTDRGARVDRPETFDLLDQDRVQHALRRTSLEEIGGLWPAPLFDWPPTESRRDIDPNSGHVSRSDRPDRQPVAGPPQLHLGSWFCDSAEASIAFAKESDNRTLIMGPWVSNLTHRLSDRCVLAIDPAQVYDPIDVAFAWLQPVLHDDGQRLSPHCFVMGSHRWTSLDMSTPSSSLTRKLFAHSSSGDSDAACDDVLHDVAQLSDDIARLSDDQASSSRQLIHLPTQLFPSLRHSDDHTIVGDRSDVIRWKTHAGIAAIAWAGSAVVAIDVDVEPMSEPGSSAHGESVSDPAATTAIATLVVTFLGERSTGERFRITDAARLIPTGRSSLTIEMPAVVVELTVDELLVIEITGSRFPRYSTAAQADRSACSVDFAASISVTPSPCGFVSLPAAPPLPERAPDGVSAQLLAMVDERTGIVTAVRPIEHWPGVPNEMDLWAGEVSDVDRHLGWPADRVSMGMAIRNPAKAWNGAVGEAIERYCGNFVPDHLVSSTYRDLQLAQRSAIDPTTLALYSSEQYDDPSCPFTAFTHELAVRWAEGRWMDSEDPVLVPASLVWVNYHLVLEPTDAVTNFVNLAGLATGPDRQSAELAALEEIIERDASVIWWHSGGVARPITFDDQAVDLGVINLPDLGPGWFRFLSPTEASCSWTFRAVAIPTTLDVSVVGVLIRDSEFGICGLGIAARPNPRDALAKALSEAVSLQSYAFGLLDRSGDLWELASSGRIDLGALKEPRKDRSYKSAYRPDFRDVRDLSCHSQIWLDPQMEMFLDPIISKHSVPIELADMATIDGDTRTAYLQRFASLGMSPCSVDVTTPDVAATGLCVVRVVVPGAYSNPPAAFPLLGGRRLYDDPVTLGLRATVATSAELVLAPIPHT